MGFLRQAYWSGLPFPYPVGNVLSELSTMTHQSWVTLNGMAHSFIELDKAEQTCTNFTLKQLKIILKSFNLYIYIYV